MPRAPLGSVLWGINTNAMNPKPLLAALLLSTGIPAAAQVTLAPLPTHAPQGLATQLQAALTPALASMAPCTVRVAEVAEGRHGSGAALVMGQAPALWLVLTVEWMDARGQARRTELYAQGRDSKDLMEALADRMEASFGTWTPVPPAVEEPVQARRER